MRLFDRDRRLVALTPVGAALLPPARVLLEQAEDLRRRAAQMSASEPVRLGYVSWLPAGLTARTSAVAQLYLDAWVAPSHAQAARVADGSLDLAVCWVRAKDLEEYGLSGRLIGADRLHAVAAGEDTSEVRARDTAVLLDDHTTSGAAARSAPPSWPRWTPSPTRLATSESAGRTPGCPTPTRTGSSDP